MIHSARTSRGVARDGYRTRSSCDEQTVSASNNGARRILVLLKAMTWKLVFVLVTVSLTQIAARGPCENSRAPIRKEVISNENVSR